MTHLVTLQRSPALAAASVDVEPGTRDLRSLFGVACPPRLALACVAGSKAPRICSLDTESSQQWQLPMYSCYNCLSRQTKFSPMAAEENYQGGTWKGNVSPTADFACLALLPKAQRDKNKQSWIRASSQNMKSMTCPPRTIFCDKLCLNKSNICPESGWRIKGADPKHKFTLWPAKMFFVFGLAAHRDRSKQHLR